MEGRVWEQLREVIAELPHPGQLSHRLNTPAVSTLFEKLWKTARDR